jgi:hypothetical protein
LVRAASDKRQVALVARRADGVEDGGNDEFVELCSLLDQFERRLEVVEKGVDVSNQANDVAARDDELGELDGRYKVLLPISYDCNFRT